MERQWERGAVRRSPGGDGLAGEPAIGELLKQLSNDGSHLVRQEINLAKTELRDTAAEVASGVARLSVAAGIGVAGLLAFTAFLVVGIGDWIGNYWASALIVSAVLLATAAVLARRGVARIRSSSLAPTETIDTLKEDSRWAARESRAFRNEMTS